MPVIKRTTSDDNDFQSLVAKLDAYLAVMAGDEHAFYAQYNKIDSLKNVVLYYHEEQAIACGAFKKYDKESVNWDDSKFALDISNGIYGVLEGIVRPQNKWLGKNGKYYDISWGGNQYTGSRSGAFRAANIYKLGGRLTLATSALIGVAETFNGYEMDGGQFGYNAQRAAFSSTGSLAGGLAGAEAGAVFGAAVGVWFGGVGAVPGAVIGGFIGGLGGGKLGEYIGGEAVDYYHRR